MKNRVITIGLLAMIAGCVPSLHQLYTADTVVFEEKLIGSWQLDEQVWKFAQNQDDPNSYTLGIAEKDNKESLLAAHLVKIKEKLFLDLYPGEMDLPVGDWYKFHIIPVHTFVKVADIGETLKMSFMDPSALKQLLAEKPGVINYEDVEGNIVLTAKPEQLQMFLTEYSDYPKLFGEVSELEKYVPSAPAPAQEKLPEAQ